MNSIKNSVDSKALVEKLGETVHINPSEIKDKDFKAVYTQSRRIYVFHAKKEKVKSSVSEDGKKIRLVISLN